MFAKTGQFLKVHGKTTYEWQTDDISSEQKTLGSGRKPV